MRVAGLPVKRYDIEFNAIESGELYLAIYVNGKYMNPIWDGTFADGTSMGEITDAAINGLLYDKQERTL